MDSGYKCIRKDEFYDSPLLLIRGICDICEQSYGWEYVLKPMEVMP